MKTLIAAILFLVLLTSVALAKGYLGDTPPPPRNCSTLVEYVRTYGIEVAKAAGRDLGYSLRTIERVFTFCKIK